MSAVYVFGYGSLMNPPSIERSFGRSVDPADLIPVRVSGYRRGWYAVDSVFSEHDNRVVGGVFHQAPRRADMDRPPI